ncbi:MAG: hypothetical protein HYY06_22780 [Deltaproteobacteria bacterium]|nr:hypothetical protein [Deltaproteobacteria bacterium]
MFQIPRPARAPSLHVPKPAMDVPVGLSVVGIGNGAASRLSPVVPPPSSSSVALRFAATAFSLAAIVALALVRRRRRRRATNGSRELAGSSQIEAPSGDPATGRQSPPTRPPA